jgi:hypothetical protein
MDQEARQIQSPTPLPSGVRGSKDAAAIANDALQSARSTCASQSFSPDEDMLPSRYPCPRTLNPASESMLPSRMARRRSVDERHSFHGIPFHGEPITGISPQEFLSTENPSPSSREETKVCTATAPVLPSYESLTAPKCNSARGRRRPRVLPVVDTSLLRARRRQELQEAAAIDKTADYAPFGCEDTPRTARTRPRNLFSPREPVSPLPPDGLGQSLQQRRRSTEHTLMAAELLQLQNDTCHPLSGYKERESQFTARK